MANQNAKQGSLPVRWSPRARVGYSNSLSYIAAQDRHAADLVTGRVASALALIQIQPDIGTLVKRGLRRFPIPKTGHVIDYRVTKVEIRIIRWARQTRMLPPARP
ncbi:hypothetical protein GJ699_17245 [Duganella sp. FT80W]|uniref:Type II toxin-antitoxin system RelE/ParE family toxin n=1 Tax=Duganella guangzhouensis TaxID=2666084 RepID=A0A6I2L1K9_9BURK|nr:hypothetical protein [Duganella guangzhouensis]